MKKEYEDAFVEIDQIFKQMPIDLLIKIPLKFRKMVNENKSKDYTIEITDPFDQAKLKEETIVILGLIYRDFLASPEERKELQLKDDEEIRRIEKEMQEQYDVNNMFEKRKSKRKAKEEEYEMEYSTDLTLYKEPNFIKKFFNLIKGIFKKNKF